MTINGPPFDGPEQRATIRLENYWLSLRRSSRGPFFSDFRPARNPVPWKNCLLACGAGRDAEITFDHLGAAIVALFETDGSGPPETARLAAAIASRFGDTLAVLENGRPARRDGSVPRPDGTLIPYRSVLLPFVGADQRPLCVLGAVTYRLQPIAAG